MASSEQTLYGGSSVLTVSRRLLLIFMLVLMGISVIADESFGRLPSSAKAQFNQAQKEFEAGLIQTGENKRRTMLKSAALFLGVVDRFGIENGYLYYNTGNAYYEADELGRAILYYRKAQRLLPGYSDLQRNLALARERADVRMEKEQWWNGVLKGAFFWHYAIGYDLKKTVFLVSFTLFWLALIGVLIRKHLIMNLLIGVLSLVTVSSGGSFLLSAYQIHFSDRGVITELSAVPRKGPGLAYNQAYDQPIPQGVEFRLLKKSGDWWRVELPDGNKAWIEKRDGGLI